MPHIIGIRHSIPNLMLILSICILTPFQKFLARFSGAKVPRGQFSVKIAIFSYLHGTLDAKIFYLARESDFFATIDNSQSSLSALAIK